MCVIHLVRAIWETGENLEGDWTNLLSVTFRQNPWLLVEQVEKCCTLFFLFLFARCNSHCSQTGKRLPVCHTETQRFMTYFFIIIIFIYFFKEPATRDSRDTASLCRRVVTSSRPGPGTCCLVTGAQLIAIHTHQSTLLLRYSRVRHDRSHVAPNSHQPPESSVMGSRRCATS